MSVDIVALKAQVDAEIAVQLNEELDSSQFIHRRAFRAAGINFLVGLEVTSEVAEMPSVYRLPGAPMGVKGLVNRHGRVIPVIDVVQLLGVVEVENNRPWLLICDRNEAAVGLIIDSLPEKKSFLQNEEISLNEIDSSLIPYARTAYIQDKAVWIDLDSEAFFTAVFNSNIKQASII
jgi:chemotaxis signal transduction protein